MSLRFLQAQPDARLVELARQGHEPAFEALVRRYRKELLAYCRTQLASYKCLRSVDFEAELPRAPTGKLYKRLLRDRYWAGRDSKLV